MEDDNSSLKAFMWTVVAVATPLVAVMLVQAVHRGFRHLTLSYAVAIVVFSAVLIVGELFPIPVARGAEAGDEITVSSTFGFALLLITPVVVPIAAQAVALVIDGVVRHRRLSRLPFNVAQYAVAFLTARIIYSRLAGQPFTPHANPGAPYLVAALAGALGFLLVNNFLVGCAIALSVRMNLRLVLRGDLAWQIWTSAPLLGLGPLAAQAMSWTPLSVILLLVPIVALHRSGRLAMQREQEALRDTLTGLGNRNMLHAATARAMSEGNGRLAMLLLDLDHFKDINDTLGHAVGDEMLLAVSRRLTALSGPRDLVCRLGGDEFVVLRRRETSEEELRQFAETLCAAVCEPVILGGVTLTVGCSVGIALAPDHAGTLADLLRCADIALYSAKTTRGAACVYDRVNDRHSAALLGLHADLRTALDDESSNQIWVAFQPQLDVRTGTVSSVECLARWRHPTVGSVEPDVFVPIAENTSLVNALLFRILDATLRQLTEWDAQGLSLNASVNLSARQLADMALPDIIARHLDRYDIAPERIVLEVTESRLMANPEHSSAILRRVHDMGVRLSIDDFGTGYSSLSYLQKLSVDELKIDKSFTAELGRSGNDAIVRSTIDLGHNLGLRVVAEGVEDLETAKELRAMGCDLLQGYLVGAPMVATELPAHLSTLQLWLGSHDRFSGRTRRSLEPAYSAQDRPIGMLEGS